MVKQILNQILKISFLKNFGDLCRTSRLLKFVEDTQLQMNATAKSLPLCRDSCSGLGLEKNFSGRSDVFEWTSRADAISLRPKTSDGTRSLHVAANRRSSELNSKKG